LKAVGRTNARLEVDEFKIVRNMIYLASTNRCSVHSRLLNFYSGALSVVSLVSKLSKVTPAIKLTNAGTIPLIPFEGEHRQGSENSNSKTGSARSLNKTFEFLRSVDRYIF
jgi:hypothetical protein